MEQVTTSQLDVSTAANGRDAAWRRKTTRKSRSKGLRTKTGCITCRKRHKKCNEVFPVCGNCAPTNRTCLWPDLEQPSMGNHALISPDNTAPRQGPRESVEDGNQSFADHRGFNYTPDEPTEPLHQLQSPLINHVSPANTLGSEFLTADLASVRWLDLLAEDALQANRGFTRPSSPNLERPEPFGNLVEPANQVRNVLDQPFPSTSNEPDTGNQYWQLGKDIVLKDSEIMIFRNFVEHSALGLDLFDPEKHFSVYTTRLALRNTGLMKAILALSAQHLSRQDYRDPAKGNDPNLAMQYYYETLHYVQTALHHNSYAHSEELLATALIISTYEMLHESQSEWQRHLKGVFWIQRSQNVDGASGGIRQAVWWAWLRQDVWAAFRERRRCFSFWKPIVDYPDLSKPELVDRVVYLFSQAVNFCADPTDLSPADSGVHQKTKTADTLLAMLDRWRGTLGDELKTLPVPKTTTVFQPLWIHPPKLGVPRKASSSHPC
ncbi:Adhesion and hyphal regulator [Lachnellula occidentalis]|uniref:Adhesion and hyphal regulator n=1 Tax=Lachnellula occidentalis TaxID=215460 RepID=A0A8H8RM67_9HELO|nr:Adhesion and hyphal regulator [Lachnellula occidentalis]